MATLATIKLDKDAKKKIARLLGGPLLAAKPFFDILGALIDRATMMTFRLQGARAGHPRWKRYSPKTVKTPAGTWKIRYGTDLRGRPPGTYIPGVFRPGIRRYGTDSKLLQASGMFRQSFGVLSTTNKGLIYGTRHKLASKIMRLGRQALFVMPTDYLLYSRIFKNWYLRAIRSGAIR